MLKFEKHIMPEIKQDEKKTIIDCLSENTELNKRQLKLALKNGCVWLQSAHGIARSRRAKKVLKLGDQVHIYYDEEIQLKKSPLAVLIADEGDYSIWNKSSGMYSQGSKWGDHCTIYRWAEQSLLPQRPAFVVHRLDRAASGLIILAHKKTIAAKFSNMFEKHEIYKKYKVTVEGVMNDYVLPYTINLDVDNKRAESEIIKLIIDEECNTTEVEIVIKTGRKHQIRKHLSELGYPITGDRLYGAKNLDLDLQLCSSVLKFKCPVSGEFKHYVL